MSLFKDDDGDELQVDHHDEYVEITTWHDCGAWPCSNPETIRELAADLIRAAERLERNR